MTNYYTTQMRAFEEIDKRINTTLTNGGVINIDKFVLDFSSLFPISPKAIEKRIYLYVSANKDNIEIVKNEVRLI